MKRLTHERLTINPAFDQHTITGHESPFDLSTCARPNVLALEPCRRARVDHKDDRTNILLDANENAYGPALNLSTEGKLKYGAVNGYVDQRAGAIDLFGLNRYPDPHQNELKQFLCALRNTHHHTPKTLLPENIFVGVGSDEAIWFTPMFLYAWTR